MAEEGPTWVVVLCYLYRSDRLSCESSNQDRVVAAADPIHKDLSFNKEQVDGAVRRLVQTGMVEKTAGGEYIPTSIGIETAREHYLDRQQTARRDRRAARQRSNGRAGLFASVGILLLGLFSLVGSAAAQLGVSVVAWLFLAATGTGMVLVIAYLILSELTSEAEVDTTEATSIQSTTKIESLEFQTDDLSEEYLSSDPSEEDDRRDRERSEYEQNQFELEESD